VQAWDRHHDDLYWQDQITKCAQSLSDTYTISVHYIGSKDDVWNYPLKQGLCN
jgi:hypothetical protein